MTLTGVAPAVGYNLGLILLFALVGTAAYSLASTLTRQVRWAWVGPLFVLLVGNLDGLEQFLGHGAAGFDFFHSARIVESGNTITEFPAFSFLLGDLHPHVTGLAFTLLVIGVAVQLALAPVGGWARVANSTARRALTLGLAGLAVGALYLMNSWDWPTYLFLLGAALVVPGVAGPTRRPLAEGVGLAAGILTLSYLFYYPFHHSFSPQYSSFGLQAHGSPPGQVLTMFGLFLLPIAAATLVLLGGAEGATAPRSPADPPRPRSARAPAPRPQVSTEDDDDVLNQQLSLAGLPAVGPGGRRRLALIGSALALWLVLSWVGGLGTLGLLLPLCGATGYLAWTAASQGQRLAAVALLLCTTGLALVLLVDVFYLKDNFCGALDAAGQCTGSLYRMNTVFKFYYQAWTLLALGAGYSLSALGGRPGHVSTRRRVAVLGATMLLVLAGGAYLVLSLGTPTLDPYTRPVAAAAATLDGAAYLTAYSGLPVEIAAAIPADAAAIRWLTAVVSGHPTILEADLGGGQAPGPPDYWPYPGTPTQELMMARISVFTGLPAVLGWGYAHEGLWHGNDVVSTRFTAVQTMYTTTNLATLRALLSQYNVGYIYLGQIEAYTYYGNNPSAVSAAVERFRHIGHVVYSTHGVTIVRTAHGSP